MNYNNLKSTVIRGSFSNLDYSDKSVKASAFIANDISISGQLYTNNINTVYLNNYNVSSFFNSISGSISSINLNITSLSGTIYNTNTNLNSYITFNNNSVLSLSNLIYNNNINQSLINSSISSTIYNTNTNLNSYITSNNNNIVSLSNVIYSNNNNQNIINNNQSLINISLSNVIYSNNNNQTLINNNQSLINISLSNVIYSNYINQIVNSNNSLSGYIYSQNIINSNQNLINISLSNVIYSNYNSQNTINSNQNLINMTLTNTIFTNNNNQALVNVSLSNKIYTNFNSTTTSINNINTILSGTYRDGTYTKFGNDMEIFGNLAIHSGLQLVFSPSDVRYLTLTQLNYFSGITSDIQAQFNNITSNYATSSYVNSSLLNYLLLTDANTTYLNKVDASNQYLSKIDASNQYLSKTDANTTYLNKIDASSNYAPKNYVSTLTNVSNIFINTLYYLTMISNNTAGSSLLTINVVTYDSLNKIFKIPSNGFFQGTLSGNITGNSVTSNTSSNVAITTDNTSTLLYIPMTTASVTNSSVPLKINSGLSYNASNNSLSTTTFIGNLTGTASLASTITGVLDNSTTLLYFCMCNAFSSPVSIRLDNGITYNANTNTLSVTSIVGNLTGNCSGSSGSCTGNSVSSSSCSGNSATSTTSTNSINVGLTLDTTSTALYIPFSSNSTTSTAPLKINSLLKYNASTNAISCSVVGNVVGNVTGSIDGVASTSYTMYNTLTTGSINFLANVTSGILNIGKSAATGAINLLNNIINIGTSTSTITMNGTVNISNTNIMPPASILTMAFVNPSPTGYLLCDGASYSTTTYASLYNVIGTTYGSTGGTGFFNVPNFQGMFLRGGGTQTKNGIAYTSNVAGTFQSDQVGAHSHTNGTSNNGVTSGVASANVMNGINNNTLNTTENRPCNYAVYYFIKY
jgi:microcystin-dependent protein